MPSPVAHAASGYLVYRFLWRKTLCAASRPARGAVLLATFFLALLPDLDAVAGLLAGNLGQFHNNRTHSLLVGLAVAAGIGLLMKALRLRHAGLWSLTALVCYELHLAMDFVTRGSRGLMAFWPVTAERFGPPPVCVFSGLHYAKGLFSMVHVWTALNELVFVLLVAAIVWFLKQREKHMEPHCSR